MKGNICVYGLNKLLCSKMVSRATKLRIYKTVIRHVVTYGCEVWTLSKVDQALLSVWERKVLRRILGGKRVGDKWERRTNKEVNDLFGQPVIIGTIKSQRLRWLVYLSRMANERVPQ